MGDRDEVALVVFDCGFPGICDFYPVNDVVGVEVGVFQRVASDVPVGGGVRVNLPNPFRSLVRCF